MNYRWKKTLCLVLEDDVDCLIDLGSNLFQPDGEQTMMLRRLQHL